MQKQTSIQKLIYKLPSSRLRQSNWNLTLPFSSAMNNGTDLVAMSDSQILRWICELNGQEDFDKKAAKLKKEIHIFKNAIGVLAAGCGSALLTYTNPHPCNPPEALSQSEIGLLLRQICYTHHL